MAAITQLRGFGAFTGRRYGSFANKAPHPVSILTQLRGFGAHTGQRYGSFAGKPTTVIPVPQPETGVPSAVRPYLLPPALREALRRRIIREDDLLLLLMSCIDGNALRH